MKSRAYVPVGAAPSDDSGDSDYAKPCAGLAAPDGVAPGGVDVQLAMIAAQNTPSMSRVTTMQRCTIPPLRTNNTNGLRIPI